MAEFARGRVCRGRLCRGPSLSGAEFVRGRDVQYPQSNTIEANRSCLKIHEIMFNQSMVDITLKKKNLNLLEPSVLRCKPLSFFANKYLL